MGVKAYMLSAAINCIIGQRLVRKAVDPIAEQASSSLEKQLQELMQRTTTITGYTPNTTEHIVYKQNNTL
jgi:type II secretory ATPase GspE/PulE/Tfp pilus assembly ATPase PilB-like protein